MNGWEHLRSKRGEPQRNERPFVVDGEGNVKRQVSLYVKWGVIGVIFLIVLCTCLGCFYKVESGERGVLLRFGDIVAVEDPGLHFKTPYIETVEFMSVRSTNLKIKTNVYSADTQAAEVELSVNFQLNPADIKHIYATYGQTIKDRIIAPQVQAQTKDAFGTFTAINIVRSRDNVARKILDNLQASLKSSGVDVTSVQIENLDFSDEYERSVEERMKAEVEVAKLHQSLEQQKIKADMMRTEAQGLADAKLLEAKANAEALRLAGDAEAHVIEAKTRAMNQAGANYIELIRAEKWDGKLPQTMVPNQSIPIISTK